MLLKGNFKRLKAQLLILFFFFVVNRISVHAKQRQIHKNFAALRDKGLNVLFSLQTLRMSQESSF